MKTTTSGRAFAKNIFDLFSTLMISLPIENHKVLFKSYPNSFTAEEAISNLGGLQFIQSNHDADPKDPTRIITRVVTTQFSLSRDMAKNLCQTFMDARLFESASDPGKREFQNKGIYQVTGKGAHIVEKFVNRNSLSADATKHITANATPRIMVLERAEDEDAIVLNHKAIDAIFKRFAGLRPNVLASKHPDGDNTPQSPGRDLRDRLQINIDRCNGIEVKDQQHNYDIYKHTFYGKAAVDWLMDYTTVITKEEAICIAQEMVTCRYIEQVGEENRADTALFKTGNSALYHFTEMGRSVVGWESQVRSRGSSVNTDWMDERGQIGSRTDRHNNSESLLSTQFKLTSSTMPRLPISIDRVKRRSADESTLGGSVHHSNNNDDASTTVSGGSVRRLSQILSDPAFQILSESGAMSSYAASSTGKESVNGSPYHHQYNYREGGPGSTSSGGGGGGGSITGSMGSTAVQVTTSNTTRLNLILSNTTLRDLFKSFLKQNICEENLAFYLEVLDYKSKFNTLIATSRAYAESMAGQDPTMAAAAANMPGGPDHPASLRELEKQICTLAFAIHETYLVSGAPRELNLPHQMRMDITAYMQAVVRNMDTQSTSPTTSEKQKPLPSTTPSSPSRSLSGSDQGESGAGAGGAGADKNSHGSGDHHPHHYHQKELIHIALFDRIHDHIFRLMSTDSVPKFTRTNMYREVMMNRVKQQRENNSSLMSSISSLSGSHDGKPPTMMMSRGPERTVTPGV
ncbi:hypothetical protein KVV02_008291 [Mortierella alpina]|uniref:Uncharacterized protein n=1 Tax=Mortierella alpina TaxID=64518 RepID=A0A9P7ZZD3_MORAP|nr:hypothetical protein KVV02_008291 [Mortierella alpina]